MEDEIKEEEDFNLLEALKRQQTKEGSNFEVWQPKKKLNLKKLSTR